MISKYFFGSGPFVKASWLHSNKNAVKIIDGTWHMGASGYKDFFQKRIPGAVHFDIDKVCRKDTTLPHMIPTKEQFDAQVSELGLSTTDNIVVYDNSDVYTACRVYWTFKYFGHSNIAILDGGLQAWINEKYPVETTPPQQPSKGNYISNPQPQLIRTLEEINANTEKLKSKQKGELVVDARGAGRFNGTVPEPRIGIVSGHIPFSKNLPFNELIDSSTRQMKTDEEIKKLLLDRQIDWQNESIILSCGSGVTASVIYVALEKIGAKNKSVYDGSWTEYGDEKLKNQIEK